MVKMKHPNENKATTKLNINKLKSTMADTWRRKNWMNAKQERQKKKRMKLPTKRAMANHGQATKIYGKQTIFIIFL